MCDIATLIQHKWTLDKKRGFDTSYEHRVRTDTMKLFWKRLKDTKTMLKEEVVLMFNYNRKDMIYSIAINGAKRRITLCFHSFSTKTQFANNHQVWMKSITN